MTVQELNWITEHCPSAEVVYCCIVFLKCYLYSVKQAVVPVDSESSLDNTALDTQACWRREVPPHFLRLPLKNCSFVPPLHPPPLLGWGWEVADGNTGG